MARPKKEEGSTIKKLIDQSGQVLDVFKGGFDWAADQTRFMQKRGNLTLQLIKLKRQETRLLMKLGQRLYSIVSEEGGDNDLIKSLEKYPVIGKLIEDLKQSYKEMAEVKKAQDKL